MNLLMSDRKLPVDLPEKKENQHIDLSEKKIANCVGCFGCWVKTPGKCVIRDDAVKIYPLIAQSKNLLYVSRLYYGSYDIAMKTMLERAIPVQQAFIRIHNQETHHVQRAVTEKNAVILAYGDITKEEQEIFRKLVARNAQNMCFRQWDIQFLPECEIDAAIRREVQAWENV